MFKKLFIISMMVGMSTGSFAVTVEEENELLLKAIVEGSTSTEQKAITGRYISMLIEKKKKEASKYRELAQVNHGGKARYQNVQKQDYLKKAKKLEKQIQHYKTLALNTRPNGKQLKSMSKIELGYLKKSEFLWLPTV